MKLAPTHQQQHGHAQDPVQLARRAVPAGEEDAQQVQHCRHHQQVGRPVMDVAQQVAKPGIGAQRQDIQVGLLGAGGIVHLQEDAGDGQDGHQQRRQTAQPPGVGPFQRGDRHFGGVQVQHQAVHHHAHPAAVIGGNARRSQAAQPLEDRNAGGIGGFVAHQILHNAGWWLAWTASASRW